MSGGRDFNTCRRKLLSAIAPLKNTRLMCAWRAKKSAKSLGTIVPGSMLESRLPLRSQHCRTSHKAMPYSLILNDMLPRQHVLGLVVVLFFYA